jgi:hypothetical protein
MYSELGKIDKAKIVLQDIVNGVNPLSGKPIAKDNFVSDARITGCFNFITEVLDNVLNGVYRNQKLSAFIMTEDQKSKVTFPEGKIGVNEFSRRINAQLNLGVSKKLTGVELNKRLKKMGILSEIITKEGKTRTVVNPQSAQYGLENEKRSFNGVEYDMVVISDKGKKYLLDNLEEIMAVEV